MSLGLAASFAACAKSWAAPRIPVRLLERYRRLGVTERDLLDSYLSPRAEDLANAWAYARIHAAEINKQTESNEEV